MFKRKSKPVEIRNVDRSISLALSIGFDLYDTANKRAIEGLILKDSVSIDDLRSVLWHIQNEYLDTYKEVKEFRSKYGVKFDKIYNEFVTIEEE